MNKSSKIKIGGLLAIIVALFLALIPISLKFSNSSKENAVLNAAEDVHVEGFDYEDGYNLIKDATDLQNISKNMRAKYKLTTDIDMSYFDPSNHSWLNDNGSNPWMKEYGWFPISGTNPGKINGSEPTPFSGELDGNGYKLLNFKIDGNCSRDSSRTIGVMFYGAKNYSDKNSGYVFAKSINEYEPIGIWDMTVGMGLFHSIENASIKNLYFENSSINLIGQYFGYSGVNGGAIKNDLDFHVGLLAGFASGSNTISMVYAKSPYINIEVTGHSNNKGSTHHLVAGGLIGKVASGSTTIQNSAVNGENSLSGASFGDGRSITMAAHSVNGSPSQGGAKQQLEKVEVITGGLVGSNSGTLNLNESYFCGNVYNQYSEDDYKIKNKDAKTNNYVGGLVGYSNGTITSSKSFSVFKKETKIDNYGGDNYKYIQPIVGYGTKTEDKCYYLNQSSDSFRSGSSVGVVSVNASNFDTPSAELLNEEELGDFVKKQNNISAKTTNSTLKTSVSEKQTINNKENNTNKITTKAGAVEGFTQDKDGYNLIKNATDLRNIEKDLSAKYRLANDITLDNSFGPISTRASNSSINYFRGELDGNGYSIKNYNRNIDGDIYAYTKTAHRQGAYGVTYTEYLYPYCTFTEGYAEIKKVDMGIGLFYGLENATIKNLIIEEPNISVKTKWSGYSIDSIYGATSQSIGIRTDKGNADVELFVGILSGFARGTNSISQVYVKNPYVSVAVTAHTRVNSDRGDHYTIVGGLIGKVESGKTTITNCAINCETSKVANFGDGRDTNIAGYIHSGNEGSGYQDCGFVCVGGFIGWAAGGFVNIRGSYFCGNLYGYYDNSAPDTTDRESYVGGMFGHLDSASNAIAEPSSFVILKDKTGAYNNSKTKQKWVLPFGSFQNYSVNKTSFYLDQSNAISFGQGTNAQSASGDSISWFNSEAGFTALGWIDKDGNNVSGMRINAGGTLPIPSAFAYQVEISRDSSDGNKVALGSDAQSKGYSLGERTETGKKITFVNAYYEREALVAHGNDGSKYYIKVNGKEIITYTLSDFSKKVINDVLTLPGEKIVWNKDRRFTATISKLADKKANVKTNQGYLLKSNLTTNLPTSSSNYNLNNISNFVTNKEVLTGGSDVTEGGEGYTFANFNKTAVSLLRIRQEGNTYIVEITSNSTVTHSIKLTIKEGYSIVGIGFTTNSGMSAYGLGRNYTLNQYYYEKESTTSTNQGYYYDISERDYYLIFQYKTTTVNLIADRGGIVTGHLTTYDRSTDTETSNAEVTATGKNYDWINPRTTAETRSTKYLTDISLTVYLSVGVPANATNHNNAYVSEEYNGYIFTGWTIWRNNGTTEYWNGSSWQSGKVLIPAGSGTTTIKIGMKDTDPDENYTYNIQANFDTIKYYINLWDDKIQELPEYADKEVRNSELQQSGTNNPAYSIYNIQLNIETQNTELFKGYKPTSEGDGVANEDRQWAILLNNGNVVGNPNLRYNTSTQFNINGGRLNLYPSTGTENGNWNFIYSYCYKNVDGYIVIFITGLERGSWSAIDNETTTEAEKEQNKQVFSTYTVLANSSKRYNLVISNDGDGSLWSSGQVGEAEGKTNGLLGIGYVDRNSEKDKRITQSGNNISLLISACNAFQFFGSYSSSSVGTAFYKINSNVTDFSSSTSAKYYVSGSSSGSSSVYYNLYNYGYEITGYTIKLNLSNSVATSLLPIVQGTRVREFYLVYDGDWVIKTQVNGNWYQLNKPTTITGNSEQTWVASDSKTMSSIEALHGAETNVYANANIMKSMSQYIDEVFAGEDKDAKLEGMSLSMRPSWQAVEINGTYTGYTYTKTTTGVSSGYRNSLPLFTQGTIKYGEAYSFAYADSLAGKDSTSLVNAGKTLAYLYKNGLYCVNNAVWNYYVGTRSTAGTTHYSYGYNATYGRYMYTINFTSRGELNDIYKVYLEGDIDWDLGLDLIQDIDRDGSYSNYYTIWGSGEKRTSTRYNYQSIESGKYVFNWYSYNRYKAEKNNNNYLWADEYYNNYFTNSNINGFCYQYNRYTTSPKTYTNPTHNSNNVQTSLTHNISGLNKLFNTVEDKNLLLYIYQDGEERYIYLTANTTAIMPVFYKNGNEKFYKLNYWKDLTKEETPTHAQAQKIRYYTTGKYSKSYDEVKDEGTALENRDVLYINNYQVENYQTAKYVLTANFYRDRYYLNLNTFKETLFGRYGYGLVYIKDEEDSNRYSQVYLAISEEGAMVYYPLNANQVEIIGKELSKKISLNNLNLTNGIDELPIYAGCDIYLLAVDQSKDTEAMSSGKYDELIGYRFKEFGLLKSVSKSNAGMEYAGESVASVSSYYAYLNRDDIANYIDKIGARTGHKFKIDLIYTDIQYDLTIELSPEGNYNSGSFKWTNGFAEESGKQEFIMSATVSDQIEYLITYVANAGYEFQENAISLSWANEEGQTILRRVNAYLVLTADGKGTEWRNDVSGIAENRILYSKLANADGTFEQTYNFKIYGTWLRLFYYNNQDTSYKVGLTKLGTMHINTKEIDFTLGIRYYDMNTGEDLAVEEKAQTLRIATQPKVSLVTTTGTDRVPYGMSVTTMYGKPAYVYEKEGTTYTMVQSYMYSRANPSDANYDRQFYGLPYYTEDLNNKAYNIENNFTMRVNYAVGAIISQASDERTIYYVFAVKELLTMELEVEYKAGDVNNADRTITLRNSMRKSDKELMSYGTIVNSQTTTLKANAEHNDSNYLTNGNKTLLTLYTYQDLENNINNNYDSLVRYSGVKYTYNGEEVSNKFKVTESGTLKVTYIPKPLNVVEVYHISYWDDDIENEEPIEKVVEGQYLIDQKIIAKLPEKKIDNMSAYSEEMTKAYVDAVVRILTEGMELNSDYEFSYTINGKDTEAYTVTGEDYTRRQGTVQIDYYFDVINGNLIRYQFNIAGYEEGEEVGTFSMTVIDENNRQPTEKDIDNTRKGVRVLDGKGLKLTLKLNTGYNYVSYTHNTTTTNSTTKPDSNGEMTLIQNFSTEAGDGGEYVFNIEKTPINVKLEIEEGLDPSEDYTLNNGLTEQVSYVNNTVRITKAENPAEELLEYYYMVGGNKETIPHNQGLGELKLTSELIESLTNPSELTIYVKYINKWTLKINLADGAENLGEEQEGEIRRYITRIGGEETSITEADGTSKYYQDGTEIEVEVLLALTDKYTVTVLNKKGERIHQGADALKFNVTLTEDEELTISCVANSYRIETTTQRSNTLSQINGTNKEVLGTSTIQSQYGTRYEQSYQLKANGGMLRSITMQGNDTPTVTIEILGTEGNYTIQARSVEEVSVTGNTITVKWQVGEEERTASYNIRLAEGILTLSYQIQNHSQITLNYLAYKNLTQVFN